MSKETKRKVITIDFNLWCTQKEKAEDMGIDLSTFCARVRDQKRGKYDAGLQLWTIPELNNITLVRR